MPTELRRLPRRQVDTLHPDVRSLVLQFQLSLGAAKQGSPVPQRSPAKKVPPITPTLPRAAATTSLQVTHPHHHLLLMPKLTLRLIRPCPLHSLIHSHDIE